MGVGSVTGPAAADPQRCRLDRSLFSLGWAKRGGDRQQGRPNRHILALNWQANRLFAGPQGQHLQTGPCGQQRQEILGLGE